MPLLLSQTRLIVVFVRGRYLYVERSFVIAKADFQVLMKQYQLRFYLETGLTIAKVAPWFFGGRSPGFGLCLRLSLVFQ